MLIRSQEPGSELHVDFVPMVDVLFNLLIFFLLATSMAQAEREMSIALPHSRAAGPISAAMREIIINVSASGGIEVAGKTLTPESLVGLISEAVRTNPDQKVSVRGDRAASYANIAAALDACKSAGVQQPYLDTIPIR